MEIVDFVLFVLILVISASIGFFQTLKHRHQTISIYLMTDRSMGVFPVFMSLISSYLSANTLLGVPGIIFKDSTMFWWIGISYGVSMAITAHCFLPVFYRLRVVTVYEYLEERFSKKLRLAGSILYCILMIFYLATVLYGPAVALYTVASLPHSAVDYIQAAVGLVCILYTSLGGMRAILWVDTFQTLTIIIGLVITLVLGTEHQEGFGKVWEKTGNSSKIKFFDYNPDPEVEYTIWSMLIGGSILYSAIYSTNQAQVQTACTSSTLSKAQIAVWLTFPGLLLIISLCCLIGVVMSAFYITRGDPKEIFNLTKSDQYLPYFVMEVDKKSLSGFQGLFWGCIFSGTMSSVSSGLNSMTAVILREFNVCCLPEGSPNRRAMLISRILVIFLGFLSLGITFMFRKVDVILEISFLLFGSMCCPLFGVFLLGMSFPWANKWGAYCGLGSSIFLVTCILIGRILTRLNKTVSFRLFNISYMWFGPLSVFVVMTVGIVVSFCTGLTDPETINPQLLLPVVAKRCRQSAPSCCCGTERRAAADRTEAKDGNTMVLMADSFGQNPEEMKETLVISSEDEKGEACELMTAKHQDADEKYVKSSHFKECESR